MRIKDPGIRAVANDNLHYTANANGPTFGDGPPRDLIVTCGVVSCVALKEGESHDPFSIRHRCSDFGRVSMLRVGQRTTQTTTDLQELGR